MSARIVNIRPACSAEPCRGGHAACPTPTACHAPQAELPPRAKGLASAFSFWKRWSLGYKIRSNERYLALCEREGITGGHIVEQWKAQLCDMRAELARLKGGAA